MSRDLSTRRPKLKSVWRASGGGVKKQKSRSARPCLHRKWLIETLPRCDKHPFESKNLLSSNIEEIVFCISDSVSIGIVTSLGIEWVSKKMNWAHWMISAGWVSHFIRILRKIESRWIFEIYINVINWYPFVVGTWLLILILLTMWYLGLRRPHAPRGWF